MQLTTRTFSRTIVGMIKTKTVTATQARSDLYNLIDQASKGLSAVEIVSRGKEPVILMSKAEVESWEETLDVLSSPPEMAAIRAAQSEIEAIPHQQVKELLDL
jgi:prevent-host-death family protein